MQKSAVVKEGEGLLPLDVSKFPNVARVVCDGRHHYVYDHGDVIPPEHSHDVMTARGATKKKKKK